MMRRYRGEILVFFLAMALCVLAIRVFGQDPPKPPAATLRPGDEVKPTELEAAKLGKLKAQLEHVDAQVVILQQQFQAIQNERVGIQSRIDLLVKDVQSRLKIEKSVDVLYDQKAGEDGTFRVNAPPPPPPPAKK